MPAEESILVPVVPDDTVDSILKRIRDMGARSVELLVPDDTAALQAPRGFERLRRALDLEGVRLLVISSDAQTLEAARRNRIETVGVQGTRVQPVKPVQPPQRPARQAPPGDTIDSRDAALLDALDQMPGREPYADLQDEDAELYAAIDELPETPDDSARSARPSPSSRGDAFDDELDDLPDLSNAETLAAAIPRQSERATDAGLRRYNADEIEHSAEELARQRARRAAANRARAELRAGEARGAAGRQATTGRRYRDEDEDEIAPRRAGRFSMAVLLPIAIVALLALVAALWLLNSRVTVTVAPPAATVREFPFTNEVIPLAASGSGATSSAVQAAPVTADVDTTVTGQITQETQAPTGSAKGTVTVINTIGNAVPIPKGSEFVGKNQAGQEVRFLVDNDTTIPGATTSTSLTGSSTTYGQASVAVTARSPGSASNVPPNSITTLLIPGQQPYESQKSNFVFQNDAIGGGSESAQRVVTEDAVQGMLQTALTQLYKDGIQGLQAQVDASKLAVDQQTLVPSATDLGTPENYQVVSVDPPIGNAVDANNPTFKLTVHTRFSALATPSGKPVASQLGEVVKEHFAQLKDLPCKAGEIPSQDKVTLHWDGQKLTVDGTLKCTPTGGLPAETIARVKDALKGQSRETAEAGLKTLQQQGAIGGYQLPAGRASFPNIDWLIDVQVGQPQTAEPRPSGAPAPSQSATP